MTELAAPPKRRTGLLIGMIVSQLLAIGSLLIWAVVAGLSGLAFVPPVLLHLGMWIANS